MNFLAKHFFDYQSFVNLPYKAVQLHKPPPSQAGVDPSVGWAPKSMHTSGKNQSAPPARANRNNHEVRPGGHRHGRPSKLEFREWGERHGELKCEKNIGLKDAWMASLDGEFKHFHEVEEEPSYINELIPKVSGIEDTNFQILVILTYAPHVEFLTVTVKKLRGFGARDETFIKLQLYDGISLAEERQTIIKKLEGNPPEIPAAAAPHIGNHVNPPAAAAIPGMANNIGNHVGHHRPQQQQNHQQQQQRNRVQDPGFRLRRRENRRTPLDEEISESFLFHASPHRLTNLYVVIQMFDGPDSSHEILGKCIIGLSGSSSRGIFHWRQMIRKHGTPVCMWHKLSKPIPKHHPLSSPPPPSPVEEHPADPQPDPQQ
uniref:Uncharacterized protein n=1 Tax=Panagrolaimus davidi TaxID=227884 RepID=A0A914PH06_9BILA